MPYITFLFVFILTPSSFLACTCLFSNHSSSLTGSSGGSGPADAATLGAREQRLTVVLAGPAVTGMLLCHVLLCGSLQVQFLQTSTPHLLHQLVQRTQLGKQVDARRTFIHNPILK